MDVTWVEIANALFLINFMQHFSNEESCEIYLKSFWEKTGARCKSCQVVTKHYWFRGRKFFECSKCSRRSSLKSGTIMEHSKLPIQIWLLALLLVSATKKGFSYLEFQRQLCLGKSASAFRLMHKISVYMGKREALYTLSDMV
ncbi:MAG: hypothetical protein ACI9O5_000334 [Algoriphagus sp.]